MAELWEGEQVAESWQNGWLTEESLMENSKRVLAATVRAQAAQTTLLLREKALLEEQVAKLLAFCDDLDRRSYDDSLEWKTDVEHEVRTATIRRFLKEQ